MPVSSPELWNLLRDSRLLTAPQVAALGREYAQQNGGAPQDNPQALSQWLIARKAISPYQSKILLAGRSGPFYYGQYKVFDRIDAGRFAGMFRAFHVPARHPVLLEFLTGPAVQDAGLWRLIAEHAEAHQAVKHQHLNRCYETVDLGTFKFAALEDLRGESLDAQLRRAPLPPAEACRVARSAALALAQLHLAGLTHADVRPANLWLESTGNVKLLRDPLMLSAALDRLRQTAPEAIPLRADYLAPELAHPGHKPDALTDLYALGCTLYELLAGRPPFAGGDVSQKLQRHAAEAIQPLEQQGVPQPIAQIVTYLMAKNPAVRYQEAVVVAEQLTPFCDAARLGVQPPPPPKSLPAYEQHLGSDYVSSGGGADGPAAPPAPTTGAAAAGAAPVVVAGGDPRLRGVRKSAGPRLSTAVKDPASFFTRQNTTYAIAGGVVLVLMLVVAILFATMGGGDDQPSAADAVAAADGTLADDAASTDGASPTDGATDGSPTAATDGDADGGQPAAGAAAHSADVSGSEQIQVVADDGQLLWNSPTRGEPLVLDYAPSGSKVFLVVRPADLVASGEGENVLRALGPNFAQLRTRWEAASGYKLEQIQQLIVTLHSEGAGTLRPAFVVRPTSPIVESELVARWGSPSPTVSEGEQYYKANGWAFYIPPSGGAKVFTMATEPDIARVIENHGNPLLGPEIDRMLQWTDADRHVNVVFDPFFINNEEGQQFFTGPLAKLRPELTRFLGEERVRSSLVSLHFRPNFYLEMRILGTGMEDQFQVATALRQRLGAVPSSIEEYMTRINPAVYWKKLAYRLVPMINELHNQTRVGTSGEVAVVNAVLPPYAAPNLVLGGELLVSSTPGAAAVAAAGPTKKTPQTLEELLAVKTTIQFPQHDLINAVALVKEDLLDSYPDLPFKFDIKMNGTHLMEEGITQNQAVRDFDMRDKPISEILTAMMMKANPVPTVKEPTEEDQKLLWVIAPEAVDPAHGTVLITTRKAAKREGYPLPAVFDPGG